MKTKYLNRIYEGIALLLMFICVGQILWGAPNYDAQLSELKTAMNQSWQLENQKAAKDMHELIIDVRKNGNSREGRERVKLAELLIKKTTAITNKLEQWRTTSFAPVQIALKKYKKWFTHEFEYLDILPIDTTQTLTKSFDLSKTSTIAAQALISEKKLHIQRLQAMVFRKLGSGADDFSDGFGCSGGTCRYIEAVPKVNKVQVGDDYQADMYYAAKPNFIRLSCFLNNQVLLAYDGHSKITFQPNKTGRQQLEVKVKYYDLLQDKKNTHVHKIYYEVK
jgi:hypothetical protein